MTRKSTTPEDERIQTLLEQINPEFIRESARKIRHADVEEVFRHADDLREKFDGPTLSRYRTDALQAVALIEDYWTGRYRQVPYWSLAVMTFALLYVLKPIDIIPDSVPIIGQLDDAMVVSQCLAMVESDLREHTIWHLASEIDEE